MKLLLGVFLLGCLTACNSVQNPAEHKPADQQGQVHFMEFPVKAYQIVNLDAPYSFEIPVYAQAVQENSAAAQDYWNNIDFPRFDARLHLTYYPLNSSKQFEALTEEARKLAMRHSVRASAINPEKIDFPQKKVFGLYYFIEGDAASSVQFYLTDSVKHYFRGALYFNQAKNYDSIKPVIQFLDKDIRHLVETFEWKSKSKP